MKAEHLNAFIQGAQNVFSMFFGVHADLGKVFVKESPYKAEQVCVEIGIMGGLQGKVLYNMNEKSAFFIASKLMMGMPVESLDEMAESAVSEMTNMISGQVATVFFENGINVDITTPTLLHNADKSAFDYIKAGHKVICIPLILEGENVFEIDLLLSD